MVPWEFFELFQTIVHEFDVNNDRVNAFLLVECRSARAREYVIIGPSFGQEVEDDNLNVASLDLALRVEYVLNKISISKVNLSEYNTFLDGSFFPLSRVRVKRRRVLRRHR